MILPNILLAPTEVSTAAPNLIPLVFLALMLDVLIVVLWYFIGVAMKNDRVKESAKGEYYQFLGTAFLTVLLIWGIVAYSSLATSVFGSTTLMSPTAMQTLCNNIQSTSKLDIISNSVQIGSFLHGFTSSSGKVIDGTCNMINPSGGGSLTDQINYPLLATSVVIANLTNQSISNLNASYTFDAFLGFLSSLSPTVSLCFAEPPAAIPCLVPTPDSEYISVTSSFEPYAGYEMLYKNLGTLGTILNLSMEAYIAQLLVIVVLLFIWPYLLFGGLVLRSTFFTRRLGGLLIAIALGAIIIFPTLYAIEYVTLAKGIPILPAASSSGTLLGPLSGAPTENQIYGFNALTSIPQGNDIMPSNYILNFFVMPNFQQIIMRNHCWIDTSPKTALLTTVASPIGGILLSNVHDSLAKAELVDIGYMLIPGANIFSLVSQVLNDYTSSNPSFYLPYNCQPKDALNAFFELYNSYGIVGVTSYFLPIVNLIITLSAIIGMSGLLGGATTLQGLSRFV